MKVVLLILVLISSFGLYSQKVSMAHDFTITNTDGNTVNLYHELDEGKTVLLFFFSVNCGHCHLQAPDVDSVWQRTGSGTGDVIVWGFESTTIEDITDEGVENFITETGIGFPCFSNYHQEPVHEYYVVTYTPQIHVICPDKRSAEISFHEIIESIEGCRNTSFENAIALPTIEFECNSFGVKILNNGIYPANVEIFTMMGVRVSSFIVEPNESEQISLSGSNQMYLIRTVQNGKIKYQKIIY